MPASLPPLAALTDLFFWNDGRMAQGRCGGVLWFFFREATTVRAYVDYQLEAHPDAYFGDDSCGVAALDEPQWTTLCLEVARRQNRPETPHLVWPDEAVDAPAPPQASGDTKPKTQREAAVLLGVSKSALAVRVAALPPEEHEPPAARVLSRPDAKRVRREWFPEHMHSWWKAAGQRLAEGATPKAKPTKPRRRAVRSSKHGRTDGDPLKQMRDELLGKQR